MTFYLILAFLFLLPWQTRWIFAPASIQGEPWEYGTKSLYGTEILIWLIVLFFVLSKLEVIKSFFGQRSLLIATLSNRYSVIVLYCFLLLGLVVVACWGSNPGVSCYFIYRLLLGLSIGFIISQPFRLINQSTNKLLTAFWGGGVVQGLLAVGQFFSQYISPNKWLGIAEHSGGRLGEAVIELAQGRWLRAYGAFGWPNSLGIYLAVTWVMGLLIYIYVNNSLVSKKIPYLPALLTGGQLVILSGLIVSFSRGAWLATGAGVLVLIAFLVKKHSDHLKAIFFQLGYALAVISFFFITLHPLFTTRFTVSNPLETRSINERVGQWQKAFQTIRRYPFTGVGPGVFTWYLHQENPSLRMWDLQPIHMIYLLALAETGVIVTGLYIVIFLFLLRIIWKCNALYLAVIMVPLVAGLFDHWLWSLYGGIMVWWVVWGLGVARCKVKVEW